MNKVYPSAAAALADVVKDGQTTAVGRFEQLQLQAGGTLGRHVYWRFHAANRNPLIMRDPNALAGDHGTPERVPGNNDPVYESGFPILYDTLPVDVSSSQPVNQSFG